MKPERAKQAQRRVRMLRNYAKLLAGGGERLNNKIRVVAPSTDRDPGNEQRATLRQRACKGTIVEEILERLCLWA